MNIRRLKEEDLEFFEIDWGDFAFGGFSHVLRAVYLLEDM